MSKIMKLLCSGKSSNIAYLLVMTVYAIIPEASYKIYKINAKWDDATSIIVNRLIVGLLIYIITALLYNCYRYYCTKVSVNWDNYSVQIEYGNIFEMAGGKKVINFDECFTTKVGEAPSDIKPDSLCGQYLTKHPINNMEELINQANIKPARGKSKFNKQTCYVPGTIVPNGEYLLMAFVKLSESGLGRLDYEEYLACLNELWKQIDLYHGTEDVYIPVLGARITRFDKELTQQQLLDIIICSYRLSPHKMKKPNKLHIVCRRRERFSLNNILGID